MRSARPRTVVAACLAALLALAPAALARLSDADFRKAKSEAERLMKRPDEDVAKERLVAALRDDDSQRALEVLVDWAAASAALRAKLEPDAQKAQAEHDEFVERVQARGRWTDAQRKKAARLREKASETATLVTTELDLGRSIGDAIARTRDPQALAWLAGTGVEALLAADGTERALEGAVRVLLTRPPDAVGDAVLRAIARPLAPPLRIEALEWVALELVADAGTRLGPCLESRSVPVRRAAVRAARTLDDPRVVPSLVEALGSATGLLASEMEDVLHWFTGQSFGRDGEAWKRWWTENGKAWLENVGDERHGPVPSANDVSFYGITSPSDRIVFVLDRSGSMEEPAKSAASGPVTGGGEAEGAAGLTRLDVAKTELRHAINRLGSGVKFNVVFYNHRVDAWRLPPELVPATRDNKASARTWFMAQEPIGSTELFAALAKALEYADDFGGERQYRDPGADTIFLLSDGAPTTEEGGPARLLTEAEIDAAVNAFLEANERHRVVVHTVGVGPTHNQALMRRLAEATGGTYVAVGMD